MPYIIKIHGDLTDSNCAARIVIHFSAPVSHPYVDTWPRLSLVLSLSPQYLNDQKPTGIWYGEDTLMITFAEHNCSSWNHIDSHIIFNALNGKGSSIIFSLFAQVQRVSWGGSKSSCVHFKSVNYSIPVH